MTPLLAQTDMPSVVTIWNWLPSLCAMAAAVATLGLWANSRKTTRTEVMPNPLVVKPEDDFVHKNEFETYVRDYNESLRRIESDRTEANGVLHEKINKVDRRVAGLEASANLQNSKLNSMETKIDNMPSRIVADLRNSKGLLQ